MRAFTHFGRGKIEYFARSTLSYTLNRVSQDNFGHTNTPFCYSPATNRITFLDSMKTHLISFHLIFGPALVY